MSTAILISGQMRTFAQCYPTQRWHVFRHFPDPHFFLTVQDTPDCQAIDDLVKEYGADRVHADVRADPSVVYDVEPRPEWKYKAPAVLGPVVIHVTKEMVEAYDHAPYANAAPPHQLLLQHWYQNEVWSHFVTTTYKPAFENNNFDTIIRIRPDQWFHSFDMPAGVGECVHNQWNKGTLVATATVSCPPSPVSCYTPWWGRFGGINDRFAILGPTAARAYFTVYARIPELLAEYHCPFHPESLVKSALEVAGCAIHETLRTEFTTLRTDGSHRPPEIMPWDIAHAALTRAA